MKKLVLTFAIMLASLLTIAQVPQSFSYQAVVRDNSNTIIANKPIQITISIIRDNITLYTETHTPTTNANGLFTVEIGKGSSSGNFAAIDWSYGTFFLETDSEYGTTTTQLLSVPFAMYAAKAGSVDIDLSNYVTYSQLPTIPEIPTVPTNVSAFVNDADYVKKSELPTIPEIPTVPTNVSAFENDADYVKKSELPTIPEIPTVPTNVSAFENDADYVKKSELPTIPEFPSKLSAFENDMVYVSKSYLDELLSRYDARISQLEILKKENKINKEEGEKDPTVQYVNLGLPSGTQWATCNIGADSPEKYGEYFAWGETTPKETYNKDTYIYKDGAKYNTTDGLTILEPEDDVASTLYGTLWAVPTKTEWQELLDYCFWVWTSDYKGTNKSGYIVYKVKNSDDYGKRNSKSNFTYSVDKDAHIFLPMAGLIDSKGRSDVGSQAYYWTSWIMEGKLDFANVFGFNSGSSVFFNLTSGKTTGTSNYYRHNGFSVRPVRRCESLTPAEEEHFENETDVVKRNISYFNNDIGYITANDIPTKVSDFKNDAGYLTQADLDQIMKALNDRIQILEQLKKQNQLIDENEDHEQIGDQTVEYVDFGLPSGNLWAKCNLGADSPEKYGDYYSYGELSIRTNYNLDTYRFYDKDNNRYTKYNSTDALTILDPSDDVVTMTLGAPWAIPSNPDWEELISYGYWVYTSNYNNTNKAGYIVYRAKCENDRGKKNAKSEFSYEIKDAHIFLPNGGWINGLSRNNVGNIGAFRSSWLANGNIGKNYILYFSGSAGSYHTPSLEKYFVETYSDAHLIYRYIGTNIRPVRHRK